MARFTLNFKNSDGVFTPTLDPNSITWGVYSFGGDQSKQLYKLDVGDLAQDIIGMDTAIPPFYKYSQASNKWIDFRSESRIGIDNAYGYNLVMASDGIYVAKDSEVEKIPNYLSKTLYISRISESITKDNFDYYRTLRNQDNDAGVKIIPFWVTTTSSGSSNRFTRFYGIRRYKDAAHDYLCVSLECASLDNYEMFTYNDSGTPFPQIKHYWKKAGEVLEDLDTRVAVLEETVDDLNTRLAAVEQTVKDLPAIVAAVSSNVSKLYVAR